MRYLAIYTPDKKRAGIPPTREHFEQMGKLVGEMMKNGTLLATGGLLPPSQGVSVRLSDGNFTVTDGPFAEAKEVVAGFALLQANSKEELIEMTKRFLKVAGDGESEIRPIMDGPPETK
jgi:hypothetical protein